MTDATTYQGVAIHQIAGFSPLIKDYIGGVDALQSFYHRSFDVMQFQAQCLEKQQSYTTVTRKVLYESLSKQYQGIEVNESVRKQLKLLQKPTTFTVTTGHQLNLMTGPLFFLYKIIHAINLAKALKEQYPQYDFVPVYWMATEDHDFAEIQSFRFKGKNLLWHSDAQGCVGDFATDSMADVLGVFKRLLGQGVYAKQLIAFFEKSYLTAHNLSTATRLLVHQIFVREGLVIVDGDFPLLKKGFAPFMQEEVAQKMAFHHVGITSKKLRDLGYPQQVNPRECNLFYKGKQLRKRLVQEGDNFHVLDTDLYFTLDELQAHIAKNPTSWSPNVLMRPLYQEVVLPNLAYIGGAGELAYWLQLKGYFDSQNMPFPILVPRRSLLLLETKEQQKISKLGLATADLFQEKQVLKQQYLQKLSGSLLNLKPFHQRLTALFDDLDILADKTHEDFTGALKAQRQKQTKGLKNLEKRLFRAESKRHQNRLSRVATLQEGLFPNGVMQERVLNFSEYYLRYGDDFIKMLTANIKPFKTEIGVLTLP